MKIRKRDKKQMFASPGLLTAVTLCLTAGLSLPGSLRAETGDAFLYVGLGPSFSSLEGTDGDVGQRIGIGFDFTDTVYAKFGYASTGDLAADEEGKAAFAIGFSSVSGGSTTINDLDTTITGFTAAIGTRVDLAEATSAFFEIGLFSWDAEVSVSGFDTVLGSFDVSEDVFDGTDLTFGIGLEQRVNSSVGLGASYNGYLTSDGELEENQSILSLDLNLYF